VQNVALKALRDRWHDNTNTAATNATALLSFIQLPEDTDEQRETIQQAKEEIASFGSRYLSFFGKSKLSVEELHGRLLLQFGAFRTRTHPFTMFERDRRLSSSPIQFWSLNIETELARTAMVLLTIPSSEAAVERTFSAQASIHRKKRNRMKDDSVQASMFIAFNHRIMTHSKTDALPSFKEVELSLDYADPDTEEDSDEDSNSSSDSSSSGESEGQEDEDSQMELVEEKGAEEVAAAAAPVRTATEVFLRDFITENHVHAKTRFGPDLTAKLDQAARSLNPGGGTMDTLIRRIRKLTKLSVPPL
jgi:hypothetical protein